MPAKWDFAKLGENWEFCGDIREELCLHFTILRNFLKLVRQLSIFGNEMARAYHRAYIYIRNMVILVPTTSTPLFHTQLLAVQDD